MPTYQSGRERQEIPFRSGGFQDIKRIYPHSIENNGKLVHKGYIHITLGILDNLGGFGYLDTRRTVHPRLNDQLIDFRYRFQSFGIAAETIFTVFTKVCTLSPGLIRSGEYPTLKSSPTLNPETSSKIGMQSSSVHPGYT